MKRSDSREKGFTPRSHSMASASQYLFKTSKWQPHRVSRSLAGSQMSLADPSMASTISLDHLTDSPQAGGYFRQPPPQQLWNNHSASTFSLDLAIDHLAFSVSSPLFSTVGSQHHGSAPDLRSPESEVPASPSPPPSTETHFNFQSLRIMSQLYFTSNFWGNTSTRDQRRRKGRVSSTGYQPRSIGKRSGWWNG